MFIINLSTLISVSLPVRGAWIEIWENVTGELNEAVAPRKGSVD